MCSLSGGWPGWVPSEGGASPGVIGTALHLQQASLVQGAGVDVDDVAVGGGAAGEGFVMLKRREV